VKDWLGGEARAKAVFKLFGRPAAEIRRLLRGEVASPRTMQRKLLGMKILSTLAVSAVAIGLAIYAPALQAQTVGRITGVGGIFVKSKDPKALANWYKNVLGLPLEPWGGGTFKYDAPGHPPLLVWNAFPSSDDYMAPSTREFMINFAVDDLDAFVTQLKLKGVSILKRDDADPNGKFAWIVDPDGTKIELWQPKSK
jgi:predicted enzyme related to lactoylglutathione lyase